MYDYLIDHALKNVWCTPRQDLQAVVKPARLTGIGGAWNKYRFLWREIALPLQATRFHVYQIGQLHPSLMGLFPQQYKWVSMADACNKMNLIVDIYSDAGIQYPRREVWYMITPDKNLVLAVKDQPNIPFRPDQEDLYVRVYTNAFFRSVRATDGLNYVYVDGGVPTGNKDILNLQKTFQKYSALPGQCYAFVNGFKVSSVDLVTVKLGDIVEIVYDSSIYNVVDFAISDLQTFDSLLDTKRKYLLHYAGAGDSEIDYQDDIDFFIVKPQAGGRHTGVYYHRNQADAVRMVTHKDYAVPVPYVLGYAASRPDWTDASQLVIRAHIRRGGWDRALVDENSRIKELYKLPDADLKSALLGVNSTVGYWRADQLENAPYTAIMRSDSMQLDKELVQNAYGYNAISKILADTPKLVRLESGQGEVDVPYGLQKRATGFEYDVNGALLSWHSHVQGSVYPTRDVRATMVEMLSGYASTQLDETYGASTLILDPTQSYRFYTCDIINGQPTNQWTDVTGSGQYSVVNNKVTWLVDPTLKYTLIRSDANVLAYDLSLMATDGLLKFSLEHQARRNGVVSTWVMQVPMGELDLFLNGRPLVEGIDYVVQFPQIVINNKAYLIKPLQQTQRITVRFSGFCQSDLSRTPVGDTGFVTGGVLSANNKFDIRDDKVLRITVGGALYDRTELRFAETDPEINVPDARNGTPYQIRDIVVPMRGLTTRETYSMRADSQVVDKVVSDYLTMRLPQPTPPGPVAIAERYPLFSPFCCKIIYDLNNGWLTDDRIFQQYSDQTVMEICKPYEYLLKYDPTQYGLQPDDNYVQIHPHNLMTVIDMDIFNYKFLGRVVNLYLNGKVELSHFVRIKSDGLGN